MSIKRGYPLERSGVIRQESSELGGYPAWEAWRGVVAGKIGEDRIPIELDEPLHKYYILRRKGQLGQVDREEEKGYSQWLDENYPNIFDDERFKLAVATIRDRTLRPKNDR